MRASGDPPVAVVGVVAGARVSDGLRRWMKGSADSERNTVRARTGSRREVLEVVVADSVVVEALFAASEGAPARVSEPMSRRVRPRATTMCSEAAALMAVRTSS